LVLPDRPVGICPGPHGFRLQMLMQLAAVRTLQSLGYVFQGGEWIVASAASDPAMPSIPVIPEADAMHGLTDAARRWSGRLYRTQAELPTEMGEEMKTLILGSVAATALALSIGTAAAQSQRDGDGVVSLTPEQRAIVRDVLRDELQDRLGDKIADRLSQLTPRSGKPSAAPSSRDLQQKFARGFPTGSRKGCGRDLRTGLPTGSPSFRLSRETSCGPLLGRGSRPRFARGCLTGLPTSSQRGTGIN
jgi:hypothetical protein